MAGVLSPSMPVFVIENKQFGNRACCTQNEGLGRVLRYGGTGPEVYDRLKWMATDLYPALDRALRRPARPDLPQKFAAIGFVVLAFCTAKFG